MSHKPRCPDPWEARREGERAQENGYGLWRNPYEDRYGMDRDRYCEEAADEWRRGYRRAEIREEERCEEEAARQRAARRRAEEEAEYEYYIQAQHHHDGDGNG